MDMKTRKHAMDTDNVLWVSEEGMQAETDGAR